jgi:hypothetical protein
MSTKLFQIYEDDLASLEREFPNLMEAAFGSCNDPLTRKRWDAVKQIISNVRWGYGPPVEVQTLSTEDDE